MLFAIYLRLLPTNMTDQTFREALRQQFLIKTAYKYKNTEAILWIALI
jgi:hypothetical protein